MQHEAKTGPLILVADSTREARRDLQRLLELHGCRVRTASDGAEVLTRVAREAPDLILLDVRLPRLDGVSVVRELKGGRETAHIPVILLTARGGPEATLAGLQAGANEFLAKPVDEHELIVRVENLLRSKQQYDRLRQYQERLATLLRVSGQFRLSPDPQQMLETIVRLAHEQLGFGRVVLNLLDADAGVLRVAAIAGVTDPALRNDLLRTVYRWPDVRALLRPEYRISDSYLIPDDTPSYDRRQGVHRAPVGNHWQPQDNLLVPLRAVDGALYGLLSFDTPADGLRPGPEQIQLLELFATQATAALQNAYLYADLHRHYARYVAPVVAEQLAGRGKAPGVPSGQPVDMDLVVLFADLRGFTGLSENLGAAALVNEVLNPYFTRMTEVILAYQGMVDKFLGDGIMALFGVQGKQGDEAARAITAALTMQAALRPLQQDWQQRLGRDIGMGIGMAGGKAVVGNIGSPQRLDFTAIGPVVNVASRVADLAPTGQIWATGDLKTQTDAYVLGRPEAEARYPISFRPLMPTTIKGMAGLQTIYSCFAAGTG